MGQPDTRFERQSRRELEGSGLDASPMFPDLQEICELATTHFAVAAATVAVVSADRIVPKAHAGSTLEGLPIPSQFCDDSMRSSSVVVVPDVAKDPRFTCTPAPAGTTPVRFYAGAPVVYFRQVRLGALCLLDPLPREFSERDKSELSRMADEVATALVVQEVEIKTARLARAPTRRAF